MNNDSVLPIKCENLSLLVNGKQLLDSIDLMIPNHSFSILLGPNGAGKSLLMRVLAGIISPTSGKIWWGNSGPEAIKRHKIGFLPQRPVMLRRSVRENLAFGLKLTKQYRGRSQIDNLLDKHNLLALANHYAPYLSGGEQQKLALIRALSMRPDVLFLDEPTASLDIQSCHTIETMLRHAHNDGITCLYVTHNLGQAKRLGSHVMTLEQGKLAELVKSDQFFKNKLPDFTNYLNE